jgi:hypothetical protein
MPGSAVIVLPLVIQKYLTLPAPIVIIVDTGSPQLVISTSPSEPVSFKKNQHSQLYAGVLEGVGVIVVVGVGVTGVELGVGVGGGVEPNVLVGVIVGVYEGVG